MKKTYQKPTSEAMSLGLRGEDIAAGIVIGSGDATQLPDGGKIDGGDALVKGGRDWEESSNFWGD